MLQLLKDDPRYSLEAYKFVREALGFAQDVMQLGTEPTSDELAEEEDPEQSPPERHVTGQQLCEAIRQYAVEQYGYLAKVVLNSWGVHATGDFGEIVYNLIRIRWMRKSQNDRREDFDNVYDFDEAFQQQFKITMPDRAE